MRAMVAGRLASCSGRCLKNRMKLPWKDLHLLELLALAMLAAFGCGLALAQGDFLFVGIFAATSAVTIIEAIRRSR
jgi:hypothetical protein